jgi:predicted nucleic acid-binding protein
VYAVDRPVADKAAHLIRQFQKEGVTIAIPDAVIAATCLVYDLVLVTYNKKHYPVPEIDFYPCPSIERN